MFEKSRKFFNELANEKGLSFESTDWGSIESQELRFRALFGEHIFKAICETEKPVRILDYGSGHAPLFYWLKDWFGTSDFEYLGVEISDVIVDQCKDIEPEVISLVDFHERLEKGETYDFVVGSGVHSIKEEGLQTYERLARDISLLYKACDIALLTNFIRKSPNAVVRDYIQTYKVGSVITLCVEPLEDDPYFELDCSYLPHDVTLRIYKEQVDK